MKTKTISTRLSEDELLLLDGMAARTGLDRATMTKTLLRQGLEKLRFDEAVAEYREERVTLSRAAEMAGVSVWDFIGRMDAQGLTLHYGIAELEEDLNGGA
jgi:predicted HTH domain antitoxin